MCLPFLNLFVRYGALSHGWCVAYVGDVKTLATNKYWKVQISEQENQNMLHMISIMTHNQ
jgi:hypothetical protein